MNARRSFLIQFLALALAIAMSACVLPFLIGPVGARFHTDVPREAWGNATILLLASPLALIGVIGASFALAHRGPSAREVIAALAVVAGFFVVEHGLTLGSMLLGSFLPVRPLLALAFGFFAGISPIVARVEQNPWFGVRTPWTLGSRRVWRETHRATGRLWLVGGIVGSALTMFGAPFALAFLFLVGLILTPVAISYGVWRKLGRP